ncbi:prepilin peptidase [Rickettsiella massiliensis]|uniref:prepilin peptidase n=1 Tax=Rickettsiella massiliensis TaxID=676517 RepID=UPI00029A65B6|nr:A24 family peptidase [Rickettsiella massiliensis]
MESILLTGTICLVLAISGFLAVVVYRLPLILQSLQQPYLSHQETNTISYLYLLWPNSHCPLCQHSLRFFEKIPLFSYFLLKARCTYCQQKIPIRYFLIEMLTLISSLAVVYTFEWPVPMLVALFLTWGLIVLSGIDYEYGWLPDIIIFPLLWLGLSCNAFNLFVPTASAVLGALVAYLSLWLLAKLYRWATHKEGMGYGDFKLFAVFGAWLGID